MSTMILCFNSLQTGRLIQTVLIAVLNPYEYVSIPFKREGSFRLLRDTSPVNGDCLPGFNSLQTGRLIQTKTITDGTRGLTTCFNSLQTGRLIQTDPILSPVGPWLQKPKNIRELRTPFFSRKFTPKTAQTPINTEPNAIFL